MMWPSQNIWTLMLWWTFCLKLLSTYCVRKGNIGWKSSCHNERWGTQSFWGRADDVQRLDDFAWRIAQSCLSPSKIHQISVAHHMVSRMPSIFRILPKKFCLFVLILTNQIVLKIRDWKFVKLYGEEITYNNKTNFMLIL